MHNERFKYYLLMKGAATKWLFYSLLGAAFLLIGGSYAYQAQHATPIDYQQGNFHDILGETIVDETAVSEAPINLIQLADNTYRRYSLDLEACGIVSESSDDQIDWMKDMGVRYDLSQHKSCELLDFSFTADANGGITLTYSQEDSYSGEIKTYKAYSEPGDYGWEFKMEITY